MEMRMTHARILISSSESVGSMTQTVLFTTPVERRAKAGFLLCLLQVVAVRAATGRAALARVVLARVVRYSEQSRRSPSKSRMRIRTNQSQTLRLTWSNRSPFSVEVQFPVELQWSTPLSLMQWVTQY